MVPSSNSLTHVYVASIGHSGSTILNIALGAVEGGVSVGEVEATIRRMDLPQRTCTCGASAEDCPVWKPLFSNGDLRASKGLERGYSLLYESVAAQPGLQILVDSSKRLRALDTIQKLEQADLRVIFLVRDPRGYLVSHCRKFVQLRGKAGRSAGGLRMLKEAATAVLNWWYGNRKILRTVRRLGVSYMVVSYERMVLNPAPVEQELSAFLGVPVSLSSFGSGPLSQHILRGNALRHDPERSSRLMYDYRWFYDPWVRRCGPLLNPVLAWGVRNGLLGERQVKEAEREG